MVLAPTLLLKEVALRGALASVHRLAQLGPTRLLLARNVLQLARGHKVVRIIVLTLVLSHCVDFVGDVIGWRLSITDIFEALRDIRYQWTRL